MIKIKNRLFLGFFIIYISIYFFHKHVLKLNGFLNENTKLIQTYILNGFFVFLLFIIVHFFLENVKRQLGFIFISFSTFKFLLFFIYVFPFYKVDNHITFIEILAFFIPYTLSLVFEISFLGKLLNNLKF